MHDCIVHAAPYRRSVTWSSRRRLRQMRIFDSCCVVAKASKSWPMAAMLCKNRRPVTSLENIQTTCAEKYPRGLNHVNKSSLHDTGRDQVCLSEYLHLRVCICSVMLEYASLCVCVGNRWWQYCAERKQKSLSFKIVWRCALSPL